MPATGNQVPAAYACTPSCAIGKTADEALLLWDKFRRLEDAGAFGVECELIPAPIMQEINNKTGLTTISLGSGPDADVMFLFMSDLCGESARTPRHARAYADLASIRSTLKSERVKALMAYRKDVSAKAFPAPSEIVDVDPAELERFKQQLG